MTKSWRLTAEGGDAHTRRPLPSALPKRECSANLEDPNLCPARHRHQGVIGKAWAGAS